jgi:hypothetical protein
MEVMLRAVICTQISRANRFVFGDFPFEDGTESAFIERHQTGVRQGESLWTLQRMYLTF